MLCVRQIVFVRANVKIFGASDWVENKADEKFNGDWRNEMYTQLE